jgi:glycosyltransferase involved in cell wall biosynthesis
MNSSERAVPAGGRQLGSVLIVMPRWVRDGGVGAHLMRSAAALAAAGMRVEVLVARVESDERFEGVELIHSPQLYKTDAMEPRFAEALAREPEVVHLNQLDDPQVVAFLRRSAPVVLSAHGYLACASGVHYFRPGEGCERAHGPGCVPNLLLRGCAHRWNVATLPASYRQAGRALAALRAADMTIGYSNAMAAHLEAAGVQRRRVVPYFPTLDPAPAVGESGGRIVFAGRLVPSKGAATLLHAVRGLDAAVSICGDGVELARLQRLASRLGIAEQVAFRGWLGPDELAGEFAAASLVAVPSLWPEPFGLIGIEGFAAGKPAVGSATGGIPEWLEDGVSGLTVPAGDAGALSAALGALLEDPARRAEMGAAGRGETASRYSREAHLEAVTAAYADAREVWEDSQRGAASAQASARP